MTDAQRDAALAALEVRIVMDLPCHIPEGLGQADQHAVQFGTDHDCDTLRIACPSCIHACIQVAWGMSGRLLHLEQLYEHSL